jgi:hypothetical protein
LGARIFFPSASAIVAGFQHLQQEFHRRREVQALPFQELEENEAPTYQSVNHYDGKLLKTFEEFTDKQLKTALETAATCFESWRRTWI